LHSVGCFSSRIDGMGRPGINALRGAIVGITRHPSVGPHAAITVRVSGVVLKKRVCHGSIIVKKYEFELGPFSKDDDATLPWFC
jgi:hypothetical protein